MDIDEIDRMKEDLKRPIDFDALVDTGALIKQGKSYYMGNKDLLPYYVSKRIKSVEQNRNGLKLTFSK